MSGISIITGGGSGIGRALAKRLASKAQPVLIIGRQSETLQQTKDQSTNPSYIRTLVADVSLPSGREHIVQSIEDMYHDNNDNNITHVNHLIHNAALLEPCGPLMGVDLDSWRHHMAVNVEGPLFLTQSLLHKLQRREEGEKGGRVLHVSSGAAHHGYRGWVCMILYSIYYFYLLMTVKENYC